MLEFLLALGFAALALILLFLWAMAREMGGK